MKYQKIIGIGMTVFSTFELLNAVRIAVMFGTIQNTTLSFLIFSGVLMILSLMCAFDMDTKRIFQAHCMMDFLLAGFCFRQMFDAQNASLSLNGKPDTALPGLNAAGSIMLMFVSVIFFMMCMILIFMGILGLSAVRKKKGFIACMIFAVIMLLMQMYLRFPAVSMIYTLFYLVLIFSLTDSGIFVPKKEENAP